MTICELNPKTLATERCVWSLARAYLVVLGQGGAVYVGSGGSAKFMECSFSGNEAASFLHLVDR